MAVAWKTTRPRRPPTGTATETSTSSSALYHDTTLRYFGRLLDGSFRPREGPELNPFKGIDVGHNSAPEAAD